MNNNNNQNKSSATPADISKMNYHHHHRIHSDFSGPQPILVCGDSTFFQSNANKLFSTLLNSTSDDMKEKEASPLTIPDTNRSGSSSTHLMMNLFLWIVVLLLKSVILGMVVAMIAVLLCQHHHHHLQHLKWCHRWNYHHPYCNLIIPTTATILLQHQLVLPTYHHKLPIIAII